jgi:hypothetical protein
MSLVSLALELMIDHGEKLAKGMVGTLVVVEDESQPASFFG